MLNQQQRIEISKKVVTIPKEVATAQKAKLQAQTVDLPKAIQLDNGNKTIIDQRAPVIVGYQLELSRLDGNGRSVLVEQDYLDAANRKLGNFFFYNQTNIPTPSNPDGVWKNLAPFFLGYGVGKNYLEVYPATTKEQDFVDQFNAAVAIFEAFHPMEQSTGQQAVDLPPETIQTYPAVQTALADIVTIVTNFQAFLTTESADIYLSDFDAARQAQAVSAKANLDTQILPAIATWLGYNDFNTSHGQSTVAGFYGYNTALLQPAKGNPVQLGVLKQAILDRKTFVDVTRKPQLLTQLGGVSQNVSTGEVTAQNGLYGERALGISLRINTIGGSLGAIVGIERGILAQDNIIQSSMIAGQAYDLVIKVGKFKAPASDSRTIHVDNASAFSIGDSVFVSGDGQAELSGLVVAVAGTRIDLDFEVPQKYTPLNNSRIYKTI